VGNRQHTRQQEAENAILPDRSSNQSKEDLVNEIIALKKKVLINEDTISFLKSENHRLESEATKQQRRIEQLLNLSEGVKTSTMAQSVRREIEKSILVRQLKQQLAHLRNLVADKDVEIENMKRDIRFTHVKEIEFERDEYFTEIQRLSRTVEDLKEELHRERQRREWNSKLAGETGDDLRRELAKLATGYQSILANISSTGKPAPRPSTAGTVRASDNCNRKQESYGKDPMAASNARPRSAGSNAPDQSRKVGTSQPNEKSGSPVLVSQSPPPPIDVIAVTNNSNPNVGWGALGSSPDLQMPSLEAGFNTEDYETTDGNSSRGTGIEPKTTFQPLGAFLPQQQAVYYQPPQVIMALPTIPQHQSQPKFNAGDRVKAKFRGGETYYAGRISVVQADGLYRIVYDDNDEEGNVPESRIIPMEEGSVASAAASVATSQVGKNAYKVGDKVEALYYNGTKWYKGEVKGFTYSEAKKSFVYDVVYEDGDRERQVLEANVRLLTPPIASSGLQDSFATPNYSSFETIPTIDETTIVSNEKPAPAATIPENRSSEYVPGIAFVKAAEGAVGSAKSSPRLVSQSPANKEVTGPIVEAAATISPRLDVKPVPQKEDQIISPPSTQQEVNVPVPVPTSKTSPRLDTESVAPKEDTIVPEFKVDDPVEALYDKGTMWFPGKIAAVNISGRTVTYNILYDDGDKESNVSDSFIRRQQRVESNHMPGIVASSSAASLSNTFRIGEKIEGYFEEYKAWFAGQIKSLNDDGTYHVVFDDGDEDKRVVSIRLRKKAVSIRKDRYQVGDRVEARYQGDAAWFPGKISKVNNSEGKLNYNILYDDGDTEEEVVSELIRVLDATLSQAPSAADLAAASPVVPVPVVFSSTMPVSPAKASFTSPTNDGSANSKPHQQRHGSITSTNLDNFLNELSDDDDGPLPLIGVVESSGENEYANEFEA
jgi:hypothetical protein